MINDDFRPGPLRAGLFLFTWDQVHVFHELSGFIKIGEVSGFSFSFSFHFVYVFVREEVQSVLKKDK